MHDNLKTAVITGGTKGIGAAIAEVFYRAGYAVIVCSRHDNGFAKKLGKGVFFVKADVTNLKAMEQLMATAVKKTGRIDVLVNCAGFYQWKSIAAIDDKFVTQMLDVNVKGTLWATKAVLKYLSRGSTIVNVASLAGKRGTANNSVYCASKFAVLGINQSLAKELGPRGIRVNAVCPVYIATDRIYQALSDKSSPTGGMDTKKYFKDFVSTQSALKRLPEAQEVAQACLFLASEQASAITGQSLNIDCGVFPQ